MRKRKHKLRKSIRTFYIVLAIGVIAFCSATIFNKTGRGSYKKEEIILSYTNRLNTIYKVNVKDNPFIEKDSLPMEEIYVTDLIDNIDMNFKFSYDASKYSQLNYSYSIVGVLKATYSKDGTPQNVWEKEYTLLENTEVKTSNDKINIVEDIKIDVKKYNDEIYNFEQTLGMAINAKFNVQLRVNIDGNIENTKLNNKYISNIDIELGEKTTQITGNLLDEKTDTLYKIIEKLSKRNISITVLNVIIMLVGIAWLRHILFDTTNMNTVRNNYKLELNRILKSCEDKIVKLNKDIDLADKEVIEVKDFGELIKLSEELYKPILYWNSMRKEEAEFFVITSSVIYRFILKHK